MSMSHVNQHYYIGDQVLHKSEPGPWVVVWVWPWTPQSSVGEWRYSLERPKKFPRLMRLKDGRVIRLKQKHVAWESEVYVKKQRSIRGLESKFGTSFRTEHGLLVPV